jgi:hypothetical protein
LTAAELFTGNLNNFRRIFNWTSLIGQTTVIVMRDPLSLSRNPEFFFKISKISKKIQNFKIKKIKILKFKISKFSQFSQNFKISKKFKIFIKLVVTMYIYVEVYFLKRITYE